MFNDVAFAYLDTGDFFQFYDDTADFWSSKG